jgi:hypothetical protein
VANALYRRALERFLHDHALTDVELAYLERLVRVLHIGFDHAERLTLELTKPIYEMAVREAAADHQVTEEEKASLTQMVERLRLPPALAFQIANPILGGVVQDRFNEMIADRRFSPEEFAELESLARSMSVELTMDTGTQNQLRYFAQLWQIEQGELPTLDPPIALQKAEVCHFHVAAEWHELRTRVQRIGYHGPVLSIPIVRGLRYRVGGITPAVVRSEELTQIDEGDLYFTSKRVLFNGARRNTTIRLSNLIGFQVFADGLALEKSSGRSPYFLFAQDTELAATVLSVLLANAGR